MASGVAEDVDHQVRRAVGDDALAIEVRGAGDEHAQLHDTCHAVQTVARGGSDLRQDAQGAGARSLNAVGVRHLVAQLAQIRGLAILAGDLARDVEQVALLDKRHIVRGRGGGGIQGQAKLGNAGGNAAGHIESPMKKGKARLDAPPMLSAAAWPDQSILAK